MTTGRFLTFEGGEGAGKSTQIGLLADALAACGLEVVRTREPGGTDGAEAIRRLLVEGAVDRWTVRSELLLVLAARCDHLVRLIEPALARGAWVVADRYLDSTRVYQGIAGGLGLDVVDRLQRDALRLRLPDLTLVLDLPPALGLERRRAAGEGGRFERKSEVFHAMVRDGFRALARAEPARCELVDAVRPIDVVAADIWQRVAARFNLSRA